MENRLNVGRYAAPRRKGLAVASLVVGILSFLLCSLFLVGALVGIVLGIIALNKANKEPEQYEGKGLAIAGIVLSAVSILSSGIIAAIAIPNLLKAQQAAREAAGIAEIKSIAAAQLQYSVGKGRGKFTDLQTLGSEGFIDSALASGVKGGYVYTSTPVSGSSQMYDTTAKPVSSGNFGTGKRSFYSNETYVIYETEGGEPPSATSQDRVPKNGKVIGR